MESPHSLHPRPVSPGKGLLNALKKSNVGIDNECKFRVQFCQTWANVARSIRPTQGQLAVHHEPSKQSGVSHLRAARCPPGEAVNLEGFAGEVLSSALKATIEPTTDFESWIADVVESPPSTTIPYHVGPLPYSELDSLFPSMNLEKQLKEKVMGITTLYGHLGCEKSGTAFHCEDANMRSYNLSLAGYKLWILIDSTHTTEFEALVQSLLRAGRPIEPCDQSIRHLGILISPRLLRRMGIRFSIVCAGPGDMVLTKPRQYHAVINLTASFAIATNYVLEGEEAIPKGTVVCRRDGLYGLHGMNENIDLLAHNVKRKRD